MSAAPPAPSDATESPRTRRATMAKTPCRFWVESGGCRRGSRCRFSHDVTPGSGSPALEPAPAADPPPPSQPPPAPSSARREGKGKPPRGRGSAAAPPSPVQPAPAAPQPAAAAARRSSWADAVRKKPEPAPAQSPIKKDDPPPELPAHIGDAWTGPPPSRRHSTNNLEHLLQQGPAGGPLGGAGLQPWGEEGEPADRRFSLGDPPLPAGGAGGAEPGGEAAAAAAAAAAAIATYGPVGSPSSPSSSSPAAAPLSPMQQQFPPPRRRSSIISNVSTAGSADSSGAGAFLMPPPPGLMDFGAPFAAAAGASLVDLGAFAPPPPAAPTVSVVGMPAMPYMPMHVPTRSSSAWAGPVPAPVPAPGHHAHDDEEGVEFLDSTDDETRRRTARRRASEGDKEPSSGLVKAHRRMNELADAGAATDLDHAFQQLLQAGLRPTCATFSILLKGCARAQPVRREAAVAYYCAMPDYGVTPNAVVCTALLHVLAKVATPADVSLAQHVFQRMKERNAQPNVYTYSCMISLMARAGSTAAAEALYDEMQALGLRPDTVVCTSLLSAFACAGDAERALRLFHAMQQSLGLRPTAVTFNALVSALARAGRPDDAAALLTEMEARANSDDALAPSAVTFTSVMAGYASGGNVGAVAALFQRLVARGLTPTVLTFNAIVNAHAKAADAPGAQHVLTAMRAWGVPPDLVTFNTVLHALILAGSPPAAVRDVWRQLRADYGLEPDAVSYHLHLRALVAAREWDAAERLFDEYSAGADDKKAPDAAIVNLMLRAFVGAANLDRATALYRRLEAFGVALEPDVATELLEAAVAAVERHHQLAVAVAHAVLHRRLYTLRAGARCEAALADAVVALASAEHDDAAQALFAKMRDAVPDGLTVPARSYHAVIALHARRGDSAPARFLFDELRAVGMQPDLVAYSSMINLYGSLGEADDERELLQEMLGSLGS